MIDNHPVVSEYIEPSKLEMPPLELRTVSVQWRADHVGESQYFTQIVKCTDRKCCLAPRSSFFSLFSTRFLPAPVPLMQTGDGVKAALVGDETASFTSVFLTQLLNPAVLPRSLSAYRYLPYDAYCPSVQSLLLRHTYKKCSLYHASISSLKAHTWHCGVQQVIPRVRPVHIAAQRQTELMAVNAYKSAENVE